MNRTTRKIMQHSSVSLDDLIARNFPPESIAYVRSFFEKYNFHFSVSLPRKTKKGDFRFRYDKKSIPTITVNGDLNKYEFLLVFIHEMAHFFVYLESSFKEKKHGERWKTIYHTLLTNVIEEVPLPQDIVRAWKEHLQHIKSSSSIDENLVKVFRKYDKKQIDSYLLKELNQGDCFIFRNQQFRLVKFRRTRALCSTIKGDFPCLISMLAEVEKCDKD